MRCCAYQLDGLFAGFILLAMNIFVMQLLCAGLFIMSMGNPEVGQSFIICVITIFCINTTLKLIGSLFHSIELYLDTEDVFLQLMATAMLIIVFGRTEIGVSIIASAIGVFLFHKLAKFVLLRLV